MGTVPCLSPSTKCNIPNITQLVAELQWRSPATDLSPEMLLCTKKPKLTHNSHSQKQMALWEGTTVATVSPWPGHGQIPVRQRGSEA